MLAIASLATGFVVAALTSSHAAHHDGLGDLDVKDTLSAVDHTFGHDSLAAKEDVLGQNG
ncbi:hypothetical protein [Streptomyces chiangmaiensis]|uniref:Uncharacterized protein n=1 Tax=Streptomyces chiangmaiensis TaxID=766497 RepID=A0ABU7FFQ4_9ACTN|nr:hypothetical protein [Streptomyces chiangmaiensis]MED7822427.1 hypothetical protein [Streptomyces chiangmaiensis]